MEVHNNQECFIYSEEFPSRSLCVWMEMVYRSPWENFDEKNKADLTKVAVKTISGVSSIMQPKRN